MALANYSDLQTSILNWSHRTGDSAVSAIVPDFIRLAEARFNRELRVADMEETLASSALTSGAANLPTGFLAFKELRFDGTVDYTLQPKPLEWIRAQDDTATGDAQYFAVTGSQVVCWPPTGPIKGTYYKEVPALASNSTNWLLTNHPDVYLFSALAELALWAEDDTRLQIWAPKAAALIQSLQMADERDLLDGGVLAVRAR